MRMSKPLESNQTCIIFGSFKFLLELKKIMDMMLYVAELALRLYLTQKIMKVEEYVIIYLL